MAALVEPFEASPIIENVISHMQEFGFGPEVLNEKMLPFLRSFLREIDVATSTHPVTSINIKICLDTASKILNEDVSAMKRTDESRLLFETSFVMFFMLKPSHQPYLSALVFKDLTPFFERYPEFKDGLDELEIGLLLTFRNVMRISQCVIPAKQHKNQLLDIVTRICEGRFTRYVTGGGQTEATARRVLIFSREGGVEPIKRIPKPRLFPETEPASGDQPVAKRRKKAVKNVPETSITVAQFLSQSGYADGVFNASSGGGGGGGARAESSAAEISSQLSEQRTSGYGDNVGGPPASVNIMTTDSLFAAFGDGHTSALAPTGVVATVAVDEGVEEEADEEVEASSDFDPDDTFGSLNAIATRDSLNSLNPPSTLSSGFGLATGVAVEAGVEAGSTGWGERGLSGLSDFDPFYDLDDLAISRSNSRAVSTSLEALMRGLTG